MEKIEFDETAWPLVVVRYPKVIEQQDFERHLGRVVLFIKRQQPWAMVNDSRGSGHPDAKQRRAIAAMYDEHETLVRTFWRGAAIVFDSPLTVGVVTAISWIRSPPHPFKAFTSFDDGRRWASNVVLAFAGSRAA